MVTTTSNLPLKSTQKILWQLITAPDGVEKALKGKPLILPVVGNGKLSAAQRLDIYANMYFYRILDAIKEDFPAIVKLVGDVEFHNLITRYLIKHPPTHFSLRNAGQHLSRFLEKYPLRAKFPYLSDLAKLEWSLVNSFDAKNAEILSTADCAKLKPHQWAHLRLKLVPSFQLEELNYPVDTLRENLLKNKKHLPLKKSKATYQIWRKEFKVYYCPITSHDKKLLAMLVKGSTFGKVCSFLATKKNPEKAAMIAAAYLQRWMQDEILERTA
jgi:hypothetical protein